MNFHLLINRKRSGKPITPKERPRGENVVDLMEALRRSVGGAGPAKASKTSKTSKASKKPRKAASGQKEMLMTIAGKKPAKEAAAKKDVKAAAQVSLGREVISPRRHPRGLAPDMKAAASLGDLAPM